MEQPDLQWKEYRRRDRPRSAISYEMRPYRPGEDMTGVRLEGATPRPGGMLASYFNDWNDQWYVRPGVFERSYEPVVRVRRPCRHREEVTQGAREPERRRPAHTGARRIVLIVHSHSQIREALNQVFVAARYDCLLAGDGREGLEVVRQSRPPLIVTQLALPHRLPMSGYSAGFEFVKQVGREDPDAAVIVVSAAPKETLNKCLRLGAYTVLPMPVKVGELLQTAERALVRRRGSAG